jgi:hypothetical protein
MFAEDRGASIRQSVQNGQFLDRLAQNASDLFVASNTDQRIERFLADVIVTATALDQTPILQPIEPAYDRGTWHDVGSNLCNREWLASKSPSATHKPMKKVSRRVPKGSLVGAYAPCTVRIISIMRRQSTNLCRAFLISRQ